MADNSLKKGRYTKHSNKIGLFSNRKGSFVKNDSEIVLNFPFKDTVLEAGMSKEDVGREERFLHIEVDSKDIDTLEEPKVLTNFKYVNEEGEKPLTASSDIDFFDEEGNLKQNLLIKGNNLLALHTLKERLAGKVKLIYIDPPYNTGNDGFRYNDSFNHSAWLTFMKNRLEVAKYLLKDDGVIFVHIDDNEQAYLKVLLDEIFGRSNFIVTIPRVTKKGGKSTDVIAKNHDYILMYVKDHTNKGLFAIQHDDDGFKNKDEYFEERGYYKLNQTLDYDSLGYVKSLDYPIEIDGEVFYAGGDKREYDKRQAGQHERADWGWRWSKPLYEFGKAHGFVEVKRTKNGSRIYTKTYQNVTIKRLDGEYKIIHQERTKPLSTLEFTDNIYSNDNATKHASEVLGKGVFDYTKPETLLETLLTLTTKEGDIVLDFCLGSGTTATSAHKMNRRWIGVEQMDYVETVTKRRLKKVIDGEDGGISKNVSWKGGGSFIYLELKKYNQEYIDRITEAKTLPDLEEIYVEMRNNAFLKFWFDRKEFEKDEGYRKADLEGRKQKLIDVLDENQLYLNHADMNDSSHNVSIDEKTLTDKFYGTTKN